VSKNQRPRFQPVDAMRDAQALAESAVAEEGLVALGRWYDKLMLHYYGRKSYLLNPYQPIAKLDMRKRCLLKLIEQSATAGATPELFMRAQFAQLQQYTEAFPAIQILTSERAPKRYEAYMRRMRETYVADIEREHHIASIPLPPTTQTLIESSIVGLLARLKRVIDIVGILTDETYQRELEMLARGGVLKAEFVLTLDERWLNSSKYLSEMASEARKIYNQSLVMKMKQTSKQLFTTKALDERMRHYA
jgi:hypothetical protein